MALAVTLGLLLLMHVLIQTNMRGPGEVPSYNIPEIVMPDREIRTERDLRKPERPEEPEETPPDLPEPDQQNMEVSQEGFNLRPGFDQQIEIGGVGGFGDGDMIPLTVIQPDYPRAALQRGRTGYCTVGMTVASTGATKDIHVVDCPDRVFERSSIRAAERLRYRPRVVDGQPVDVSGVQYTFRFEMEE